MRKFLLFFSLFLVTLGASAQRTVTGKVMDDKGEALIGANVLVKGSSVGTVTDFNGDYSITVPDGYDVLVISYTGYTTQEVQVTGSGQLNVTMAEGVELSEAVVTALGVTREKKSLGYATQEVEGEDISQVKSDNFVNALSGRVSGVHIRKTTNIGGSTNVVIRGAHSLQGNNQALFVIDGVPVTNTNTNSRAQEQASVDYDYGNAAADINAQDIESINVLKGAAATALYGSRAANGVIMITTKNGSKTGSGVGVTFNSNVSFGSLDKSTWPVFQKEYGAGYGPYYGDDQSSYFVDYDVDGDGVKDLVTPLTEDAAFGAPFDPNLLVFQYNAFDPESPHYLQATPWVAGANDPTEFFETPVTLTNTLAFDKAYDAGDFRLAYTNYNLEGMIPNSELKRNNLSAKTTLNLNDRLTVSGFGNFIRTEALGRNGTGYSNGAASSFRQWWQNNVDVKEQEELYLTTKRNVTWNPAGPFAGVPIYWDNPYWQAYENYENDNRNRFLGYATLNYELTDWLDIFGRVSVDTYDELQENRRAVGSVPNRFGLSPVDRVDGSVNRIDQPSGYSRKDIRSTENNYDLFLNYHFDLTDKLNLAGLVGGNIRRNHFESIYASTNGGIVIPGLYSLQNTASTLLNPIERDERIGVNGIFANASFGYDNFLYLEGSIRRDESSTLPEENNIYYYPSVSLGLVFDRWIEGDWLTFGKVRANYAQVGNSAAFNAINDIYSVNSAFNGASSSVSNTKKNSDLKPETTNSVEAGLEMRFLENRLGFDFAWYKTNSINQILPIRASSTTGYVFKVVNAGEIENRGVEFTLDFTPVRTTDFNWSVIFNWTRNRNEVIELTEGLTNLQLGSFQGGVTLNARLGQPYGVIFGRDYVYHENGQRLVGANGRWLRTTNSDNVIGDPNPDWTGGMMNKLSWKNWDLSFLIDMQKGGDIFSLDLYYGFATGIYQDQAGLNDLGNPLRDPVTNDNTSGGYILDGVTEDGSPNTTRIPANEFGWTGYQIEPQAGFVYDAGYIKLREVALSYTFPASMFDRSLFEGITLSFVGSNLWIIDKSLPHADPESGLGSGNLQGYSISSLPSTRDFSFNLNVRF